MNRKKSIQDISNEGVITLLGSALAFSLMTVCIKQLNGRLPISELVFFRSVFSLLITIFLLHNTGVSPWGINKKLLLIRGITGTGALFCIFRAINSLSLASATIIQYTYPTFIALLAWLTLGERTKKRVFLALILGWIGIQIVVQPFWVHHSNQKLPFSALIIALSGAFLTALAYVIVRKLSKHEHQLVIIFYFPLVSIPITLPFLFQEWVPPVYSDLPWIIGIGVFTQLGQVLITRGLKILPATYAGSINYTQVIFACIWGVLIFSESLNLSTIIGASLVLAGTLISLSALPNF